MDDTDLVFLIDLLHAPLTLGLRNNFSRIFDNDLVGLEAPHGSDTITLIFSLHDLNTIIVAIALCALLELCKGTILALLSSKGAVGVVTLVGHDAVVAGFPASILWVAGALRRILLIPLPQSRSIANEPVWILLV